MHPLLERLLAIVIAPAQITRALQRGGEYTTTWQSNAGPMPLTIRSGRSAENIWNACAGALSADVGSHIWVTHRIHRDLLLEHAANAGIPGWLNPPFSFFSELPGRFGIRAKPISLLDRRSVVNRLAGELATRHGIRLPAAGADITRSSMLDSLFSELLPEGVTPTQLTAHLTHAESDDFARRRNRWIVDVYSAYLAELEQRGQYDPRQIHALLADRIDNGELSRAIDGARALHLYGLYSARARRRLLRALATQLEVRVVLYTTSGAADDFMSLATNLEEVTGDVPQPVIQPAPDAWREAEWIAGEVKKQIVQEGIEPHEIAIVARTGLEDTRRTLQVLRSAGVAATARVRAPLVEIGAIKAILVLFRAAAEDWSYPNLRRVLTNPYYRTRVDVRTIDRIASEARPHSLAEWPRQLARVIAREEAEAAALVDEDRKAGMERRIERYRESAPHLDELIPVLARLDDERTIPAWIDLTRDLLVTGWLDFRRRVCRPPMERNDVVRFDQRAVRQLEKLLQQWASVAQADRVLSPAQWYALLRTLLAGQELALTTPGQKGVQILEAHDAALIPFRATYLLHANDGVFPRLPAAGGLFAEDEKTALRGAGLSIDTFESAFRREAALWDAVTSAARVTITYRTTDPKGTPLLPSLLVPAHDESVELPRTADLVAEPLNAAQETYQDACELGAIARKGEQPPRIFTADPAAMRHTILQAHAEQIRGAHDSVLYQPLDPWNGVIRDPRVLARLQDDYGSDHTWSASQLETYARNPFFYLVQRVLRLDEPEEADEETNALTSGGVAHDILELFYGDIKNRLPCDVDTATTAFIQAARRIFQERESSGEWLGLPLMWAQRKHWLCETLVKFIQWDVRGLKGDRPVWCEHVLGGDTEIAELNGRDTKGGPVRMLLRGRIDRIDRMAGDGYRVIDYKTSSVPSKGHYRDGGALQGAIYVDALRQEGIHATRSTYRSLRNCQNGAPITIDDSEYATALAIAYSIPARVRSGLFEAQLAASQSWAPWHPDASVTRNRAQLEKGASRFE
jgi:RecB family exonuclease